MGCLHRLSFLCNSLEELEDKQTLSRNPYVWGRGGRGEQGIWNPYIRLILYPKDLLFPAVIFLETLIIGAGDVSSALNSLT